ncbi:helix-turn-helix domain-containing protein [Sulfurovum sp. NBC37-1]|uniref:helix-turn-helix domain-containing protein n=1 Tax=Sulfurovum sp. (strain NBC37-1) TaxID=387093 RepID=UPI0001587C7C|nr:helix-turn-helix transcriptional regulator [Sulfurovum sp. NBC37-1]BAF72562.1 transcriptional regulator [Sulfurovum sp. NBC37-1]
MLSFLPPAPSDVMDTLKSKFRQRRKALGYTQTELSERSGVSLGSLKRFERSGQISLESLLKLALVLDCLGDFSSLCEVEEERLGSIAEVLESAK